MPWRDAGWTLPDLRNTNLTRAMEVKHGANKTSIAFAGWLTQLWEEKGVSLNEVAENVNVTRFTITKCEGSWNNRSFIWNSAGNRQFFLADPNYLLGWTSAEYKVCDA